MKQSPLLFFPIAEYKTRLKKVIIGMEKSGLDAIVLTSDENTFYFSGFRSIVWDSKVSTPGTLVITLDGSMALSTSMSGSHTARATSCVEDIRGYGLDGYPTYIKAITSLLEEKGCMAGRIGFEFGAGHKMHLNYNMTQELFTALRDAQRVDAGPILWDVRSVKSPLEIEKLRKTCDINIKAIQKGFDSVKAGMTEMEMYGIIMSDYYIQGAERALSIGLRAGKERYSQSNCPPSYRPISEGDIILVDGGPVYHGYYSDIIREGLIGKPTDLQLEIFTVAREACYKGIDRMKPGIPINEISGAVDRSIDGSRFSDIHTNRNWCGHSIGVGVHEYPMLDSGTDDILLSGMVFAIEPYLFQEGVGSLGIEENVLITETGYEILTPSKSDLIII